MSVMVLQTTMISRYGEDYALSRTMNMITGAIVCVFCVGMAVFMIVWSTCKLKKLNEQKKVQAETAP
ncbi:MAG: hypothetical protein ACK5MN_04875 [Lachnospiraceae bacterium]